MLKFSNRRTSIKVCPCNRSNRDGKFAPYVIEGEISSQYGFCHACGETFLPPLEQKVEPFQKTKKWSKPSVLKRVKQPIETLKQVDFNIVLRTLKGYEHNNFAFWLYSTVLDKANNLLKYFSIGTARDGGTLFWNINLQGKATTVKKVYYKPDSHRDKNKHPEYIYKKSNGYMASLFGEFQLSERPNDTIILVESEKTAIIGTAFLPQFIWMASGGANGLTEEKAIVLEYKKVIVLYDCDEAGRKGAIRATKILKEIHCNVQVHDLDEVITNGTDVVDFILNSTSK